MGFIQLLLIKPLPGRSGKNLFVSILILTSAVLADNRLRLKKANVLEHKTINGESVK